MGLFLGHFYRCLGLITEFFLSYYYVGIRGSGWILSCHERSFFGLGWDSLYFMNELCSDDATASPTHF